MCVIRIPNCSAPGRFRKTDGGLSGVLFFFDISFKWNMWVMLGEYCTLNLYHHCNSSYVSVVRKGISTS